MIQIKQVSSNLLKFGWPIPIQLWFSEKNVRPPWKTNFFSRAAADYIRQLEKSNCVQTELEQTISRRGNGSFYKTKRMTFFNIWFDYTEAIHRDMCFKSSDYCLENWNVIHAWEATEQHCGRWYLISLQIWRRWFFKEATLGATETMKKLRYSLFSGYMLHIIYM